MRIEGEECASVMCHVTVCKCDVPCDCVQVCGEAL